MRPDVARPYRVPVGPSQERRSGLNGGVALGRLTTAMPLLRSHIGDSVRFKPPMSLRDRGAGDRVGKIIDEVWADEGQRDPPKHEHSDPNCWGDYAFCAQLVEWIDDDRTIRLAYYRLPCGGSRWRFASQTSIETHPEIIGALFKRTLAKVDWFKV